MVECDPMHHQPSSLFGPTAASTPGWLCPWSWKGGGQPPSSDQPDTHPGHGHQAEQASSKSSFHGLPPNGHNKAPRCAAGARARGHHHSCLSQHGLESVGSIVEGMCAGCAGAQSCEDLPKRSPATRRGFAVCPSARLERTFGIIGISRSTKA